MTKDKLLSKNNSFDKLPESINYIIFNEYLQNENLNYSEKIIYFNFIINNLLFNNIKFIRLSLFKNYIDRTLFKNILEDKNIKFLFKMNFVDLISPHSTKNNIPKLTIFN
jgi:hypothetical protein